MAVQDIFDEVTTPTLDQDIFDQVSDGPAPADEALSKEHTGALGRLGRGLVNIPSKGVERIGESAIRIAAPIADWIRPLSGSEGAVDYTIQEWHNYMQGARLRAEDPKGQAEGVLEHAADIAASVGQGVGEFMALAPVGGAVSGVVGKIPGIAGRLASTPIAARVIADATTGALVGAGSEESGKMGAMTALAGAASFLPGGRIVQTLAQGAIPIATEAATGGEPLSKESLINAGVQGIFGLLHGGAAKAEKRAAAIQELDRVLESTPEAPAAISEAPQATPESKPGKITQLISDRQKGVSDEAKADLWKQAQKEFEIEAMRVPDPPSPEPLAPASESPLPFPLETPNEVVPTPEPAKVEASPQAGETPAAAPESGRPVEGAVQPEVSAQDHLNSLLGLLKPKAEAPTAPAPGTTESTPPAAPEARSPESREVPSLPEPKPLSEKEKARMSSLSDIVERVEADRKDAIDEGRDADAASLSKIQAKYQNELNSLRDRDTAPVAEEPRTIGIRNAITDEMADTLGLPKRGTPERYSAEDQLSDAQAAIAENPKRGASIVEELKESPRALDPLENNVMAFELAARKTEFNQAMEAARKNKTSETKARLDAARTAVAEAIEATRATGTIQGRALESRKRIIDEEYELPVMQAEAEIAKGRPLTESESSEIEALHAKLKEVQAKLDAAEAQTTRKEAESTLKNLIREEIKSARESKKTGKSFMDYLKEGNDKALANILSRSGRTSAGVDPTVLADVARIGAYKIAQGIVKIADFTKAMVKDIGEWIRPEIDSIFSQSQKLHTQANKAYTAANAKPKAIEQAKLDAAEGKELSQKVIFDMAREKVNAGGKGLEVLDQVAADLKPIYPDITPVKVMNIFSDYGKVRYPSKEADLTELRRVRTLSRLQSGIEDAKRKLAPKKSGAQRDRADQEIRDKMKELDKLMRESGIETSSPEEQLASRNAARKTALENQIEDLDRQLQTGEKAPKGTPVPDSAEVERLRSLRDSLKEQVREIEEDTNPPTSPEQKALNDALVSKERWDQILREGASVTKPATKAALTEIEEGVRLEIEAMKQMAKEIRAEERPKGDPNAAREKQALKSLEKSIAEYERRVREMDFSGKGKSHGPPRSEEMAKAKAAQQAAKAVYEAAKKASKPPVDKEAMRIAAAKSAIKARMGKLEDRIKNADYSKPVKRDPATDKELVDLRFQEAKLKEQYHKDRFEDDLRNRTWDKKARDSIVQTISLMRSLKTSYDVSAPLRQGKMFALSRPIASARAIVPMLKALASERSSFKAEQEIANRPNARNGNYESAKLSLTDPNSFKPSKMEEDFQSRWANKIPGVKASGRAYSTFLNRMRADTFDSMLASWFPKGATKAEMKEVADFINIATGRGNFGKYEAGAQLLNKGIFSPKFVLSRVQLAYGKPIWTRNPQIRKLVAAEYGRAVVGLAAYYSLLALMQDEKDPMLGLDPRKKDTFMTVRIGDTRIDPLAGLKQIISTASQLATGTKITSKDKKVDLRNPKFGQEGAGDVAARFVRSKMAPAAGAVTDIVTGKDYIGRPTKMLPSSFDAAMQGEGLLVNSVLPMSIPQIYDNLKGQGLAKGMVLSILSALGEDVNTYSDERKETTKQR